jgi:hypothetical protein
MVVALWLKDGIPQQKTKQKDKTHRSIDALLRHQSGFPCPKTSRDFCAGCPQN